MARTDVTVIGYDDSEACRIAQEFDARFIPLARDADDDTLAGWRDTTGSGPRSGSVVVALFPDLQDHAPISSVASPDWDIRADTPLLHWMVALGAAALLCADEGTIVAVTDCPPPLDAAGLAPEAAVAEAVSALTRSLALSEGKRGVRANTILTPCRLVTDPPIAPAPPLPGFPGTMGEDVLNAVKLILSPEAAHLSGHVLPADRGRSW